MATAMNMAMAMVALTRGHPPDGVHARPALFSYPRGQVAHRMGSARDTDGCAADTGLGVDRADVGLFIARQ